MSTPSTPTTKVCTKCHENKPLDAFGKQKAGRYGRKGCCKICFNFARRGGTPLRVTKTEEERKLAKCEYSRQWREENREQSRETTKKWREANPEKAREHYSQWVDADPEAAAGARAKHRAERDAESRRR